MEKINILLLHLKFSYQLPIIRLFIKKKRVIFQIEVLSDMFLYVIDDNKQ